MLQLPYKNRINNLKQSNPQQCNQCILRQKYVTGSNRKCFKHQFEQKQKQISNFQISCFDEIISYIQDINSLIPNFEQQLTFLSKKDAQFQIEQIVLGLNRIKQKLGQKALQDENYNETSIINYSKSDNNLLSRIVPSCSSRIKQKQQHHRFTSDKTQTLHFDIQQDIINQSIKQWVGYFSDQLILPTLNNNKKKHNNSITPKTSKINEQIILPFEDSIEMGMFKQTVGIKYEQFIKKIQNKDRLFNQAVNKLAYYVDKFDKISPKLKKQFNINADHSESSSSLFNKYLNPTTPIRSPNKLIMKRTDSGASGSRTSRQKSKQSQQQIKANTSSFMLDNVSGIFETNLSMDQAYILLMSQALLIEQSIVGKLIVSPFEKEEQQLLIQ